MDPGVRGAAVIRRRIGPLDCVIGGGDDDRGGGDGPMVVMLHGFGAGGAVLVDDRQDLVLERGRGEAGDRRAVRDVGHRWIRGIAVIAAARRHRQAAGQEPCTDPHRPSVRGAARLRRRSSPGKVPRVDDPDRDRLRARLALAGYTPGRRDVAPLVALIDDDELPPTVRRAGACPSAGW